VSLEDKIDQLFGKIDILNKKVSGLESENSQLKRKVKSLENKLQKKKNSSNSSIPPSKDENRTKPNRSLRDKTGKKTGGQKGSKGTTLKMYDAVDHVKDHKLGFCTCCGIKLSEDQEFVGRHQVVDIPPIKPIVTEHRIYSTTCQCGKTNTSQYPKEASAPISYGNSVEAAIGYLSVGQYMSMQRIGEFFEQVLNIKLSQGTISNKLASLTRQCMPMYQQIKLRIEKLKSSRSRRNRLCCKWQEMVDVDMAKHLTNLYRTIQ